LPKWRRADTFSNVLRPIGCCDVSLCAMRNSGNLGGNGASLRQIDWE
jgi:hypothetical protein